ncbi:hypothetical protein Scep_005509 [Stephania cephalantha]|uniref:Uncharacterized protein n=1 Tax=Stephania cephalantha TaxID=152367 RepID=A0AAP0PXJ8_9MAGN
MEFVDKETQKSTKARALILNTFEDLESPILSEIRHRFPKIYTIGPLHTLLNTKRAEPISISSNGLWEVDRTCMKWLDSQTPKSVIYVSFGSVVLMKHSEMMEIWHGLVNSEKPFLWVVRPDSITEELESSDEVAVEVTKKRGCVVGWAPQEEVLAHWAVGGFLGHGGWNSTLESVVAGVPMICWPHFADQTVNSRFVEEVWRVGLDMKDRCDRSTVEMMVRDLMDGKGEGLRESTARMGELARESGSAVNVFDLKGRKFPLISGVKAISEGAGCTVTDAWICAPACLNQSKPDITAPGVNFLAAWPTSLPPTEAPHYSRIQHFIRNFNVMPSSVPMNASRNSNAEFAYGAGFINPVKAINPGLAYSASEDDYIKLLCSIG